VLERTEAEVAEIRRLGVPVYPDHAALFGEPVGDDLAHLR